MSASDSYLDAMSWMFRVSLSRDEVVEIGRQLKGVSRKMAVYFFVRSFNCPTCKPVVELAEGLQAAVEAAGKSDLVKVHVLSLDRDSEIARFFKVDRAPSVVLLNGYIRYLGVPSLEEFPPFISTIASIGSGSTSLDESVVEELETLVEKEIKIQVLVTPTCPFCPYVVYTANMFAHVSSMNNGRLTSETVELYENPDIGDKYGVMSVPAVALNGELAYIGMLDEYGLLELVKRHAGKH